MANLSKSELVRNFSTPFGVLELVSQLIRHPIDDYELGSGESKVVFTNREVKAMVDDFQRNNLLGDKILDLENPSNYRALYNNILLFASKQKESSIPDRETRENILRAYQTHLEEVDHKTANPKVEINAYNESVRRAQKYWQTKNLLDSRVAQALEPLTRSGSASSGYIRQMQNSLIAELSSTLHDIDTTDPAKAKSQTKLLLDRAVANSPTWKVLQNTLVAEGQDVDNITTNLSTLLNNERLSKSDTDENLKSLENINRQHGLTPTQAKDELQNTINSWQQETGVGRNNPNTLGNDLVESLHAATIDALESPTLSDRFIKKDSFEVRALRNAITPEIIKKYNLTQVDQDRLIEAALNHPSAGTYFARITNSLEPSAGDLPDILGLRPASLVSHIAKNAKVDPLIVALTRSGYSGEQLTSQLLKSGYSATDIKAQLNNLQKYLGENHGLIDSVYKSRLAYDQAVLKIRTALSPANIPIVRNIYGAIVGFREGITNTYNLFLDKHSTIALFLSSQHRLAAWGGWINKIAAGKNLPNWLKTGLTWYKNGGYSYDGFIDSAKAHFRIKFGNWLVKQGAKVGAEKLGGKFLAWLGAGLVAGSLSGGATFAIQAGLWFMQQAKRAPEAIKNADVVAGWVLKNIAGLAMLVGIAGPTILGAIIGFGVALISFFFIGFTAPLWAVLAIGTGIGALLGFLYSQAGAITAWATGALSTFAATVSAWWAGFVSGVGAAVSSIVTTSIVGSILAVTVSMSLGNDAQLTSKMETREKPGLENTSGSPHIVLSKSVTGSWNNGNFKIDNSNVNQTLTYTIEVGAVDIPLTNIIVKDTASKYTEGGQEIVYENTTTIPALAPGETESFSYTIKLDASYRDSYLSNTVEVTAQTSAGEQKNQTTSSIIIGTPPILPMAAFAIKLASAINSCYGNLVNFADRGACLTKLNDPQINLVISTLVYSADTFGGSQNALQCVGFASAVLIGTGNTGLLGTSEGTAAAYLTHIPSNMTLVSGPPLPGDLFIMDTSVVPGTGHIGVVVGVVGNQIIVADANSNGSGVARSNATIEASRIAGFLRIK